MHNNRCNLAYYVFMTYLLLKFTLAGSKCNNGIQGFDTDQVLIVQDFGPDGVKGPINVTLAAPLQPGAIISVVTKADTRGSVNLIADDIYVIHIDARIQKNELIINTSKRLHLEWRSDEVKLPNPVVKGAKTTTTLVYEAKGYRIFINGREVAFYVHRTDKSPHVLALYYNYVYKIVSLTSKKTENN